MRRPLLAVALVCVAGAALRFATIDGQSLWYDEAVTAQLLRMDFGDMLDAIRYSESTPPLYYALAWLWTQLSGTGETGLRSLSALLGVATIPVVWALGRRLGGDRTGLIAAGLTALSPMLIWFSQEARSYALLALLGALSALLWLRALESPRTGRLLAWSAVAALALATHYFAVFLVAAQALWLVVQVPEWRARLAILTAPVVTGVALLPLLLEQRSNEGAAFIGESAIYVRLAQVPKQFLVGYDAPLEGLLAGAAALAMLAAIGGLWMLLTGRAAAGDRERWQTARLAALTTVAFLLSLLGAAVGEDHLLSRNTLALLPLVLALAGAGFAGAWAAAPRLAPAALAAVCALGLVAVAGVASEPTMQRDNWRGAARALGHSDDARIISAPNTSFVPLRYYLPRARITTAPRVRTAEVDFLALAPQVRGAAGARPKPPRPTRPPQPLPRFSLVDRTFDDTFTVLRLRAPAPVTMPSSSVTRNLEGDPGAVLVLPPS